MSKLNQNIKKIITLLSLLLVTSNVFAVIFNDNTIGFTSNGVTLVCGGKESFTSKHKIIYVHIANKQVLINGLSTAMELLVSGESNTTIVFNIKDTPTSHILPYIEIENTPENTIYKSDHWMSGNINRFTGELKVRHRGPWREGDSRWQFYSDNCKKMDRIF